MRDVTIVILNSLRIKCHIRRPLKPDQPCDLDNKQSDCILS